MSKTKHFIWLTGKKVQKAQRSNTENKNPRTRQGYNKIPQEYTESSTQNTQNTELTRE